MLVLQPSVVRSDDEPPTLRALITDPYIIIASGKGHSIALVAS